MKKKSSGIISLILFGLAVSSSIYCQDIGLVDIKRAEEIITVGGPDADCQDLLQEQSGLLLMLLKQEEGEL